jgi:hypothetical protein
MKAWALLAATTPRRKKLHVAKNNKRRLEFRFVDMSLLRNRICGDWVRTMGLYNIEMMPVYSVWTVCDCTSVEFSLDFLQI